jgi:hypothetical protein
VFVSLPALLSGSVHTFPLCRARLAFLVALTAVLLSLYLFVVTQALHCISISWIDLNLKFKSP